MYSVVTIICVDSIYTLSLSLCKKGIRWSINGTGSWDGAGGIFVFRNTFVFFSPARFGFSKKSDEKTKKQQGSPLVWLAGTLELHHSNIILEDAWHTKVSGF